MAAARVGALRAWRGSGMGGREPREMSMEELRGSFAREVARIVGRWAALGGERPQRSAMGAQEGAAARLEGAAHSIFSSMDGNSASLGGVALAPRRAGGLEAVQGMEHGLAELAAKEMGWGEGLGLARERASIGPWAEDPSGGASELMARAAAAAMRWAADAAAPGGVPRALSGFALSLCCALEGPPGSGYAMLPMPAEGSASFERGRGRDWEPELPARHPAALGDVGGQLGHAWGEWGSDGDLGARLRGRLLAGEESEQIALAAGEPRRAARRGRAI